MGDDVRKYTVNDRGRHLILIPKGWTKSHLGHAAGEKEAWSWFSQNYVALAAHLEQYKERARKRLDKGDYWWELRACDYYSQFSKPKIVYPDIAKESRIAFDAAGLFVTNTVYFVPTDDRYFLGLLNSSLMFNYFKYLASVLGDPNRGGRLRWLRQDVLNLPIRVIDFDNAEDAQTHGEVIALVDELLVLHGQYSRLSLVKQGLLDMQIEALDKRLDEIVYRLYGLSEEEVGRLEGVGE